MNRTTKILLAVAGIVVLSYPGIAWVTGMVIQSRLQHAEQQALAQAPYLTVIKREYHRGVYRSTEVTTFGLRLPVPPAMRAAGAAPALTLTVASNIRHGPFPGLHAPALAVIDTAISGPPALQRMLAAALGSKPLLEIHGTIGLFGGESGSMTSPACDLRLPDGSTVAWGGMTGNGTTSGNQARWSGELSAPRLAFEGAQGGFELTGLEYSGTHQRAFDGLYLGDGTLTIERVDGSSPRSGDYSLQRISITSTARPEGDFFDMRLDIAVDAAKLAAVQLKNLVYSESFEHIHGPSLAALAKGIRAAQFQAGGNQAQQQAAILQALRRDGTTLLLNDPVIRIRQLSFAMPEGSFLLSATISAPGLSAADLQWPAAIAALKTHAHLTGDLRVDNGLVQRLLAMGGSNPGIGARLTSFEQQGYLTAGTTAVSTHLELAGGRLTFNGHPFPPAPPAN